MTTSLDPKARDRYLTSGSRRVEGWLRPEAAVLIANLADAQTVTGAVGEIGVHHGKLFLLLELCTTAGEKAVAVDLFGLQDQNIDGSGHGDLRRFRHNLTRFAARPDEVVIHSGDSTALDADTLLHLAGSPFRLFSVDGGHTAEITLSDLQVATAAMAPGGLLILDDYFNVQWPGVSEGANRYLTSGGALVPVGSGHGKTFFTTEGSADMYRDKMREIARDNNWHWVDQRFHGSPHVIIRTKAPREKLKPAARRILTGPHVGWSIEVAMRYLPLVRVIRARGLAQEVTEVGSGGLGVVPYLRERIVGVDADFGSVQDPRLEQVEGSVLEMPFPDRSRRCVLSVDMLEHLPSHLRDTAISEMVRVAGDLLIIAVPAGPKAEQHDAALDAYYRERTGESYAFLQEHVENGLPTKDGLRASIEAALLAHGRMASVELSDNTNLRLRMLLMRMWARQRKTGVLGLLMLNYAHPLLSRANFGTCYRVAAIVDFSS